ncbi:isoprenylcysteine carboxylmethyltransferase family protein [Sphingomonas sp. LB-2]|uniref:methyltransferase family protein n=1 Tax=Sphingomonas caeni TaxID=2984949 RepID=UPI0022319B55|nr:isoprenylcysteine carboxylmethyltransferase family protein [Sphingomonas caeni]MCW3848434.1 isoprenylcysteine carboxylmethyltransferase family protein [Sphingomonas caeni]
MIGLVAPQPVGLPGFLAMATGLAAFFLSLSFARRSMGGSGGGEARAKRSALSVLGILIQMIGFTVVGMGPLRVELPPDSPLAIGEGAAVLALVGFTLAVFLASTRAMGRNWSLVARTREDHELVTWGPFAWVRHPIYAGLFAFMLALSLAFGHWRGLIVGVPLYWLGTGLRVVEEERLLRAQFGPAYDAYAARVKRFVPGLV